VRRIIVGCCLVSLFVGCSGDEGDETPAMPTGGAASSTGGSSSGGTSTNGGGTPTGGAAPTGGRPSMAGAPGTGGRATTGGRTGTGGRASGGGGTGAGATGGTPSAPNGPVDTCFGDACPLGECDNGGFFADVDCSDVYSDPVDESSMFCADAMVGGYCLTTITNVLTRWAITCSGGTPMFDLCEGACGVMAGVAECSR
jgi:hypothetical protein